MNAAKSHISLKRVALSLAVFFTFALAFADGRVQFKAQASVERGSLVRLTFTVNDASARDFRPPVLDDFEIMSGPNEFTSRSMLIENGVKTVQSVKTYTLLLEAKKAGTHSIGAASVTVDGRTYRSQPVKVTVSQAASSGKQGGSAGKSATQSAEPSVQSSGSAVGARDLYIDCSASRTKVFEQEAALLTYRIHARLGVTLRSTQLTQKPDFAGIINYDLPLPGNQIDLQLVREGGVSYQVGTLMQYVVIPQKSGEIKVPALTFDCTILQQDLDMDPFEAHFFGGNIISRQLKRTTPEMTLHVDALPEPRPADFCGGVGQLQMKGELLNDVLRTNDLATYRVTLSGSGNLRLVTPPAFTLPKDFDTFEPKTSDDTRVESDGLHGTMTYDFTFVPHNVGTYTLPAITMTYFDPATASYKTLEIPARTVHIEQGTKSDADAVAEMKLRQSDIFEPHSFNYPEEKSNCIGDFSSLLLTDLLLVAAFALVLALLGKTLRRRHDVAARKKSRAVRQAERRLSAAQEPAQFLAALTGYVSDCTGEAEAGLSTARIRSILEERNLPADAVQGFLDVLDRLEFARYAPSAEGMSTDELRGAAHAALQACQALAEGKKRPAETTAQTTETTSPTTMPLLIPFLLWLLPQVCLAAPSDSLATPPQSPTVSHESLDAAARKPLPFTSKPSAVDSLWRAKDYAASAAFYEALLADSVAGRAACMSDDVHYNLGCCFFRMQDIPHAVLCFERAVRLNPANADAVFNLRLCRTKIADQISAPSEMFFISWWKEWRGSRSAETWCAVGLGALLGALLFVALFLFSSRTAYRRIGFYLAALCFVGSVVAHIFAYGQFERFQNEDRWVLFEDMPLREAPAETAKALRTLHEGLAVDCIGTSGTDWLQIALPDGTEGWLKKENLQSVRQQ